MTGLVQTSFEAPRSWSSSPLIVIRDSFSNQTWSCFQMGGIQITLFWCYCIYYWYVNTYYLCCLCIYNNDLSAWCSCWFVVYLQFVKNMSFWLQDCRGELEGWARKPLNHTSLVAVVSPTYRPKSARNRRVIDILRYLCVVTLPSWHFFWYKAYVLELSQVSFLFSQKWV